MFQAAKLLRRGWHVLAEIHLAHWLLITVLPAMPATILSVWASFDGLPGSVIGLIGVLSFAAVFLMVLGFLGSRAPILPRVTLPAVPDTPPERVIVPRTVTPAYLGSFFEADMGIHAQQRVQPYIGKWMRLTG
ncbi:MAG: hypothetical protein ACRD3W_21780, partial [Terriglobales bacterium]